MAEQWKDDFTSYGTDGGRVARMLDGPYAELAWVDLIADPDPSAGGQYCLQVQTNSSSIFRKALASAQTTVGIAARYWFTSLPSDTSQVPCIAEFSDINNILHIWVRVNPSGYLEVLRRDNGPVDTLIGQTAAPVVIANAWRHYETKCVIDAVNGSVVIRQEGVTVLNLTGVRTANNQPGVAASISNVRFQNGRLVSAGPNMNVKDFIVWDGSGATNNNFYGSCKVYKIVPDADVSLGWTPSSGVTGWNLINETTPSDDTGYIEAPFPLPAASTFTLTDLPANTTSVKSVTVFHRSRKTDGGDCQVQDSLISGANTGNGADRTISTAYTYWWDTFDLDPGGGNWSKNLVNALKLKLNRTV